MTIASVAATIDRLPSFLWASFDPDTGIEIENVGDRATDLFSVKFRGLKLGKAKTRDEIAGLVIAYHDNPNQF